MCILMTVPALQTHVQAVNEQPLLLLLQMAPCFGQQHAGAGRQHPAATREAAAQWQDPEAGEDEATQARVRCWARDSMADQRDKLRQQLMNAFVEVDNLQKFLQYNSEGFRWGCPMLSKVRQSVWKTRCLLPGQKARMHPSSEESEADAQLGGRSLYREAHHLLQEGDQEVGQGGGRQDAASHHGQGQRAAQPPAERPCSGGGSDWANCCVCCISPCLQLYTAQHGSSAARAAGPELACCLVLLSCHTHPASHDCRPSSKP